MEECHQTYEKKSAYIWNKKWVRPYESLWSVIRNFRIVNSTYSYSSFFSSFGISVKECSTVHKIDADYAVYQTIPNYSDFISIVSRRILPDEYKVDIKSVSKFLKYEPCSLSLKLRYCPKCIEQGYHSYFHQLSGLSYCVFHAKEELVEDVYTTYSIGKDVRFEFDHRDSRYLYKTSILFIERLNLCDFNDKNNLLLPFEWKKLPISRREITKRLYHDFGMFKAISSSYISINRESNTGRFLFKDEFGLVPIVKIYNREICDKIARKDLVGKANICPDDIRQIEKYNLWWVVEISKLINTLLVEYKNDEISYKIFQIYRMQSFKPNDVLAIKLLFIWHYIGFYTIEASINYDINHYYDDSRNKQCHRSNSPICINCTDWNYILDTYGISAAIHVIELHFNYCYKKFINNINSLCTCGNKTFNSKSDIDDFIVPTYFIEKKKDEINIYAY